MPKVNWRGSVSGKRIKKFDRSQQRDMYKGPVPPNGAYRWNVTRVKFVREKGKIDKLWVHLKLVPRVNVKGDKKYKGYFIIDFLPISEQTEWRYVPFLDAIGVSGDDFENRTRIDEKGFITKIGKWSPGDGVDVFAGLVSNNDKDGNPIGPDGKSILNYAPVDADDNAGDDDDDDDEDEDYDADSDDEDDDDDSDDDEDDDDEDDSEDDEDDEDEPEPPRKSKSKVKSKKRK